MSPSGSGKTTSLRNLDPELSVVIQVINKALPFPGGKNWKKWEKIDDKTGKGSKIHLTNPNIIMEFITKAVSSGKKNIIIDDFVYLMSKRVMADISITGYDKWNSLAAEVDALLAFPDTLPDDVVVYYLTHTEEDANGNTKMKTAGKLIDNLLTPEGMFTTVLGATFKDGEYLFKTNKERSTEPYKSPMGMFNEITIPNDLAIINQTLREYHGIEH